jgi:hypothetical protein
MSSKSNGNSRHVMKRRSKEVVVSLFSLSSGNSRQKFHKVQPNGEGTAAWSLCIKYQQASSGKQILSPDTYIIITK